jgi:copper chaperone CopZ
MTSLVKLITSVGLGVTLALGLGCQAHAESPPPAARQSASTVTLKVEGMTCSACAFAVEVALRKLEGVKAATVSRAENRAVVDFDPVEVTPQQMVDAINKLGYRASLPARNS